MFGRCIFKLGVGGLNFLATDLGNSEQVTKIAFLWKQTFQDILIGLFPKETI